MENQSAYCNILQCFFFLTIKNYTWVWKLYQPNICIYSKKMMIYLDKSIWHNYYGKVYEEF